MTRTPRRECAPRTSGQCLSAGSSASTCRCTKPAWSGLNPNVTWKTRGNAAVMFDVEGDPARAFAIACALVEELADFSCENTNPGVVVADRQSGFAAFYRKAVTDFCTTEEAVAILEKAGTRYKGWKNRRGLIGATAAVASELADKTSEILGVPRAGTVRHAT